MSDRCLGILVLKTVHERNKKAMTIEPGAVLKRNTLARSGMHYSYEFFKVSHITPKGNIMGWYLPSTRKNQEFTHDTSTDCWRVDPLPTALQRRKRLPTPYEWEAVTVHELRYGVRATSCVA